MAQTLYVPLNGVSDEVKKILVSTGGLSDYVIKGYCSVGGLSKLFFNSGGGGDGLYPSLKFAYNYQKDNTYPVYRASIRDTVKYMLKKTIYISMHSSASLLLEVLETKIDEILNYVDNAASGCNQCSCGIQDISNTSITINVLLGDSQLSEVTISSAYENYKYYPIYYISGTAEKASTFCQIIVKLDGTITKTTTTTTSSLNNFIGQMVSWNSSYPTIAYIKRVSNLGVRIQQIYTSSPLADWDFTVSSIDKIDNLSVQSDSFGSLIVPIYSDGIHLTKIYSGLNIAPWMLKYCNAFEIEIGNVNEVTQYGTYLMDSSEFSLSYSSTDNKWFFSEHSLNLTEDIGVTDKTFFANSIIKITFDSEDYPSLYKDNTLIYKCNVVRLQRDEVYGNVLSLLYGYACSISSLKFYIETRPISVVPEYTYVVNNTYQVHNLLTPQVTLDALYQYFDRIYNSSLSSVAYLKEHWSEIRSDILSYISSFNTIYLSFLVNKRNNQVNITANVGQNTYPKATVIASQTSPRYGTIWRINNNTSENIQTTQYYNITVTSNSYTADTPTSWTSDMYEIGLYGAISDNVNVTDAIVLSNYGMKQA